MSEIPRDPDFYHPTDHALQMAHRRKIPWGYVAEVLAEGQTYRAEKENCKLFLREYDYFVFPIGVVANIKDGAVVTVEYRYIEEPSEQPPKDEVPKPYRW